MSELVNVKDMVANKRGYTYPCIKVNKMSVAMSTSIRNLEGGDILLILCKDGKEKAMPNGISLSARNISKLLKTTGSLTFCPIEHENIIINKIDDYMEAIEKWI